jgi:hypothetical protein
MSSLRKVYDQLVKELTADKLTDIISKLHAIRHEFTGDGAGLSGGIVVDKFITAYLKVIIPGFEENHRGESDCIISGHPLSIKKIRGKSTIALDWSKNPEDSKKRDRFNTDMMIINTETGQWWKTAPDGASKQEIDTKFFSTLIKAGIYFVPHDYCKDNICLSSNNKTNSLIDCISLYKMLKESIKNNMVIEFPTEFPKQEFDILNAFRPTGI